MSTENNGGNDERPIVNVEGVRVALGPSRRDLIPLYQQWSNSFSLLRALHRLPVPVTVEEETAVYDHVPTDRVRFTIYERASWRPIGQANVHDIDYRHGTAEYGIIIGEVDARGMGYGTEATRLMLDYAFTALGLHNVFLRVYGFNVGAMRAYTKAGFREVGRRHEAHWMGGKRWDEVFMECLASGFESPVLARIFTSDIPREGEKECQ